MNTMLKNTCVAAAAFGCWLTLSAPAQAGADGTPGARSARPTFTAGHRSHSNDTARSESSLGLWRGQSNAEWTQAWWRWWMSIPATVNPGVDADGANCGINQSGPVWFLAGPLLNPAYTRTCTIPFGKPILSAIAVFINDYPCPDPTFQPAAGQTLEDFLASGIFDAISQTAGQATLNGKLLKAKRVTTGVFGFTGATNLRAFDACITGSPQLGVSDGYFFVIEPLPRGDHVLRITSSGPFGASDGTFNLKIR